MGDIRKHRGAHPDDRKLFADGQLTGLRTAVAELSWLLSHDYAMKAALKLVGDRRRLTERQRLAVSRAACSDQSQARRAKSFVPIELAKGERLVIDGFNLIITVEAALSGGLVILGRDGCLRDLSGVHGSYRSVNETAGAILLIGEMLAALGAGPVAWILDQPISNSGRLAKRIRDLAASRGWDWTIEVAFNPDAELVAATGIVVSSDGPLLDQIDRWLNLGRYLVEKRLADSWLIDLSC